MLRPRFTILSSPRVGVVAVLTAAMLTAAMLTAAMLTAAMLTAAMLTACSPSGNGSLSEQNRADILDACQPSRVMLILDRSSSMQTGTINGATKWSIATSAIDALTVQFENKLNMGLMVFPASGQCSPGNTLVQPGFGKRAAIAEQLLTPPPSSGNWTPMAETLAAAALEPSLLPNSGPGDRYAVLITDGWQWCANYDPATRFHAVDRVQELKDQGVKTFVVGFGGSVDSRALNLMAVAAGTDKAGCDSSGSNPGDPKPCYFQADSPLQLQNALEEIAIAISGELCDGLDNNCDGQVDEDLTRECSGACGNGQEACQSGVWGGCDAPAGSEEICDGLDNNCDGTTDPGCDCIAGEERTCGGASTVSVCQPGTQVCSTAGQWGPCTGEVLPATEICDGEDNDCDGAIDEDLVRGCSTACGSGQETCNAGHWTGCTAPPVLPDVCDGSDNDCDGTVDNTCICSPGDTIPCGDSDVGECKRGIQTCDNTGNWGNCLGSQGVTTEICDGKDNDCDGKVDESNGTDEAPTSGDDVYLICPVGDDTPEPPSQSNDPAPPTPAPDKIAPAGGVSSGCSISSALGSSSNQSAPWLILLALVALLRRSESRPRVFPL